MDTLKGHRLTAKFSGPLALTVFPSPLPGHALALGERELFYRYSPLELGSTALQLSLAMLLVSFA